MDLLTVLKIFQHITGCRLTISFDKQCSQIVIIIGSRRIVQCVDCCMYFIDVNMCCELSRPGPRTRTGSMTPDDRQLAPVCSRPLRGSARVSCHGEGEGGAGSLLLLRPGPGTRPLLRPAPGPQHRPAGAWGHRGNICWTSVRLRRREEFCRGC